MIGIMEFVAAGMMLLLTGCSLDGLLKSDQLPPNVTDPAVTQTPEGAIAAYKGTLAVFRAAFGSAGAFVVQAGSLSDELTTPSGGDVDRRLLLESSDHELGSSYRLLNAVRADAGQAIGLLTHYVPDQSPLVSHAYALEAYAEVFLAELFCSGIPLSTVDYGGDFTYRPGSSTTEVLTHAQALFDTALTLAGDSTRFLHLAELGKARARLALGDYAGAAALVAAIPDAYKYEINYTDAAGAAGRLLGANFAAVIPGGSVNYSVADVEGGNGLDYRTSGDPRTPTSPLTYTLGSTTYTWYHPDTYNQLGSSPMVLASGVEARLIEAEAALQANPDNGVWLTKLNTLRTAGLVTVPPDTVHDTLGVTGCNANTSHLCGANGVSGGTFQMPSGYSLADSPTLYPITAELKQYCLANSSYAPCANDSTTVRLYVRPSYDYWSAGSGGVTNLAPFSDPGSAAGQVDLLFRERAFWLYLTGHRQGDLRRLIRQYGRTQQHVYPVGPYPVGLVGEQYGSDVTAPIPTAERTSNPLFTGCASRGA